MMQLIDGFDGVERVASQLLFQDSKQTVTERAGKEQAMLAPNTKEMQLPKRNGKKSKSSGKKFKRNLIGSVGFSVIPFISDKNVIRIHGLVFV